MIYFTADTHFGHDREFIWGPRGYKSCKEADEATIKNWNSVITDDDTVYVVGDFFLGKDEDYVREILEKLNGRIYLALGNHDSEKKQAIYRTFKKIIEMDTSFQITYNGRRFHICHYPTLTASLESDPKHCLFDIFGHTHSNAKFFEDRPYMYNVSVYAQNNMPVSIDQINEDIDNEIKKCISYLV